MKKSIFQAIAVLMALSILVAPVSAQPLSMAERPGITAISQQAATGWSGQINVGPATSDGPKGPATSNRLIVQLSSPSLAEWIASTSSASKLPRAERNDLSSTAAQQYVAQLKTEQAEFVNAMQAALPTAQVDSFRDENGNLKPLAYQTVFNGLAINPGTNRDQARKILAALPGVKGVYLDFAHQPDMYASLPLINAKAAWDNANIRGEANAGKGIKFASLDGGVHHSAAMFNGAGYSYPPNYPVGGLGLTANNNGKIIASRAYFRSWDPPAAGEGNPWPGPTGTPHGTHTSSTAAGEKVVATYRGITETIEGVAPAAWVMSYKIFYDSVTGNGNSYNAEMIAAVEDIAKDGADVLNNSWGAGPASAGGEYDPLDAAMVNLTKLGTFVSFSNGNSGPGNGTGDHPSSEYINVAASTTTGTLASGRLYVSNPTPVPANLQNFAYATAQFGPTLDIGKVFTYTFTTAKSVNPANEIGCNPWPASSFTGKAVLIARGTCNFSVKVYNAQQAGATFVVVYNSAAGGDGLLVMAAGTNADLVTIPSVFIGRTNGLNMLNWFNTNGATSQFTLNTKAYQAGNIPDFIASFSSRGPGVGNVLKPDITAPGVNILAQGFADATGEAQNLGWGQVSGTSMASPHVAGAAVLLRQIHPTWSNQAIKSALMSTSKYVGIWNNDNTQAQPLDMGAGRLDLTHAADPGVLLDPPSLSFGQVLTGTLMSIRVNVTSVATATETYALSTALVGGTYPTPTVSSLPGFSIAPASLSLAAGASSVFTVTFNSKIGKGFGDNQGYILLTGSKHNAHLPAWERVIKPTNGKVLILKNDGEATFGNTSYLSYYTGALQALGIPYDVYDADNNYGPAATTLTTIPDAATLSQYKAIIYYTGDNYKSTGSVTGFALPLTTQDMDRLTEYANAGGKIIAMGQDLASATGSLSASSAPFFYINVLGGNYLQDSVTHNSLPSSPILPSSQAPAAFNSLNLNLNPPTTKSVTLTGAAEEPPVATTAFGTGGFGLNLANRSLSYEIEIETNVTNTITLTAAHIHDGAAGINGPILHTLWTTPVTPTVITNSFTIAGSVVLTNSEITKLMAGGLYVNVHTTAHPGGFLRAQIAAGINGDGAANQAFIDEISAPSLVNVDPMDMHTYTPILRYPGTFNISQGIVGVAHREQPTLELPGIKYYGRSIYTSFGLEGVNNGLSGYGYTSREGVLNTFLHWMADEPSVTISNTSETNAGAETTFMATGAMSFTSLFSATAEKASSSMSGSTYRWDFGDKTAILGPLTTNVAGHNFAACGSYKVTVEITDPYGNKAVNTTPVTVVNCAPAVKYQALLPSINKNYAGH